LQVCIDIKKIWFASNAKGRASTFEACLSANINHELLSGTLSKDEKDAGFSMDVFLEMVNFKIALTKKECAMIEVKSNNRGTQSFDLPLHLLREKGEARARRDNYTSLLLAVWGMKLYYEMASIPEEQQETFQPFWI
jgi:hypothetical protein